MKFDSYHPGINLLFFAVVIAGALSFNQPVFLAISFLCPFVYSVKLNGLRSLLFGLCLLPLVGLSALVYCYFNHFGLTNLSATFIGNKITLEALCYGLSLGVSGAAALLWLSCVFAVVSSDKVIYLFGRLSPKLSLFLSILLRMVPRICERAKSIHLARRGVGRGIGHGSLLQRVRNLTALVSIVVTWTLENFVETSLSMRSRGYALKGRTAFSIYRFDRRDRSLVLGLFVCISAVLMGFLLDQTRILYNPEILLQKITPLSYCIYVSYTLLCLLPLLLQCHGEYRLKRQRAAV